MSWIGKMLITNQNDCIDFKCNGQKHLTIKYHKTIDGQGYITA